MTASNVIALGRGNQPPARPSRRRRLWLVFRGLVEGVGWLTLLLLIVA